MKNGTLTWRVGELEKQICSMDKKVDKILMNDLPHMQEAITSLKTRITVLTAVNVGAITFGIILYRYL